MKLLFEDASNHINHLLRMLKIHKDLLVELEVKAIEFPSLVNEIADSMIDQKQMIKQYETELGEAYVAKVHQR